MAFSIAIWLALLAYAALQVHTLWSWAGGWRAAALLPLLWVLPAAALAASLLGQDSNLWPLPVLAAVPLGLLVLLALAGARLWLTGARRASPSGSGR
jgi:hypothetical protein